MIEKPEATCTTCFGKKVIMHGVEIPCPRCTKEGREKYGHLVSEVDNAKG